MVQSRTQHDFISPGTTTAARYPSRLLSPFFLGCGGRSQTPSGNECELQTLSPESARSKYSQHVTHSFTKVPAPLRARVRSLTQMMCVTVSFADFALTKTKASLPPPPPPSRVSPASPGPPYPHLPRGLWPSAHPKPGPWRGIECSTCSAFEAKKESGEGTDLTFEKSDKRNHPPSQAP